MITRCHAILILLGINERQAFRQNYRCLQINNIAILFQINRNRNGLSGIQGEAIHADFSISHCYTDTSCHSQESQGIAGGKAVECGVIVLFHNCLGILFEKSFSRRGNLPAKDSATSQKVYYFTIIFLEEPSLPRMMFTPRLRPSIRIPPTL